MKRPVLFPGLSIRMVMVLMFYSVSVISVLLLGFFSNYYYSNEAKKQFEHISQEAIIRLNYHMDYYFSHFRQSTQSLVQSDIVQQWLIDKEISNVDAQKVELELRRYMALNYSEVQGIFLVSATKPVFSMAQYFGKLDRFDNEPWFGLPLTDQMSILPTHYAKYEGANGQPVISILLPMYDKVKLDLIGNLIIDVSLQEVENAFRSSSLGESGAFFIVSSDYQSVIYHPNGNWNGSPIKETELAQLKLANGQHSSTQKYREEPYLIAHYSSEMTGWHTVSMIRFDEMAAGLSSARTSMLWVLGMITFLIICLVPFISMRFVQPILTLRNLMFQVAKGNLEVHSVPTPGRDEFQQLFRSFNFMVSRLEELIRTNTSLKLREIQLQLQQKEAMIKALQNQINPHLLYNALGIITSMAYLEKVPMIERLARNLSDVYRYTAKFSKVEVTLEEELSILKKYLEIIHLRFPKHFQSQIYVHDKFRTCHVIKLSLQPIVENAVKYAVETRGGEGSILVSAYEDDQDLIIEIADNGSGIMEMEFTEINEQLERITDQVEEEYAYPSSLGIANVHARLVLKYGRKYGITLTSFEGRGTVVSIRIPFKTGDE